MSKDCGGIEGYESVVRDEIQVEHYSSLSLSESPSRMWWSVLDSPVMDYGVVTE